jgi:hypothetical protein
VFVAQEKESAKDTARFIFIKRRKFNQFRLFKGRFNTTTVYPHSTNTTAQLALQIDLHLLLQNYL